MAARPSPRPSPKGRGSKFTFVSVAERSHSGLVHRSRKPEWVYAHRGFESHPLRHKNFGLRIADCGLSLKRASFLKFRIPQFAIRNPKFLPRRGARVVEL